jgi:hypothetical protein
VRQDHLQEHGQIALLSAACPANPCGLPDPPVHLHVEPPRVTSLFAESYQLPVYGQGGFHQAPANLPIPPVLVILISPTTKGGSSERLVLFRQRLPGRPWLDPWPILQVIRRSCSNGSCALVQKILLPAGFRHSPCYASLGPHHHPRTVTAIAPDSTCLSPLSPQSKVATAGRGAPGVFGMQGQECQRVSNCAGCNPRGQSARRAAIDRFTKR